MTRRRLPRWSELEPLLRVQAPARSLTDRRLQRALTIADLRALARRRTPRAVFDYVDGGAEEELALRRSRAAFRRLSLAPAVLQGVAQVDPSTHLLGRRSALPLAFAPTGFTRMMQHEGEPAVARVAERAGVPYALSTMGTTSIEELAAAAPTGRRWFQLYLWRDREASRELIARAAQAGYEALVLTVDTPIAGERLRDTRNGLTIPPALTARTLADMARHPAWWANLLTTEPLQFATLRSWQGTVAELVGHMFDPSVTWDDLAWLRDAWSGPLIVKGIVTADDARRAVQAGADGIVVSDHGGRQLDRAPTPLEQLPAIVAAVGERTEVYLDGGITNGADVVAAVALGARACLVGRAYLYGLMAGGERGVQRAIDILSGEITRTLQLLGVAQLGELTADRVRWRGQAPTPPRSAQASGGGSNTSPR